MHSKATAFSSFLIFGFEEFRGSWLWDSAAGWGFLNNILAGFKEAFIYSVHTRCIVKTSGFTRSVCKNRGFF